MSAFEQLDERLVFQSATGALTPIFRSEDDIAVEPGDVPTGFGKCSKCDIEEPFLLPHHIGAAEPHENVGVGF